MEVDAVSLDHPPAMRQQLHEAKALLNASYRLSETVTIAEAADVLADLACELTDADGAHVYMPEHLEGQRWSNVNLSRTGAVPGALMFDVAVDVPDLDETLSRGRDTFVADGLAADDARRALHERHGMASLLYVRLPQVGVLVLWWNDQRSEAPDISPDMRAFLRVGAQALRRRLERNKLRDLTLTDPLTRLVNRRGLVAALERLPAQGALLLLDLDHFKRINDTHGHRFGDRVLQMFADELRRYCPDNGCVARWGGEEFAVVLPENGRHAGMQLFAQLQAVWQRHDMTFSAGLAQHRPGSSAEETIEAADRALYLAKQSGRDRLVHAPDVAWEDAPQVLAAVPRPRSAEPPSRGLTLDELDAALEGGLVLPHYQPVSDTRSGRVVAVEALARLRHPRTGALLPPVDFLPLAERTGRVRRVDAVIAATAIRDVAAWRRDGHDLAVGVNVSVDHLDDPDLARGLLRQCAEHGLDPDALVVEITETLQSVTGRGHAHAMRQLREAGVNVTLDDFGTGFSSLSYLLRFPVAGVKIDRSFTAALDTARGRQLVMGILDIAASMGLHVVAEGVETLGQLQWLTQHGCPFVQGYLLGRPMPSDLLALALRDRTRALRS